jgi:hypothetical protein
MSGALLLLPVVVVVFLCPLSNGFVVGSWLVRVSTDTPNNVLTTDLVNDVAVEYVGLCGRWG